MPCDDFGLGLAVNRKEYCLPDDARWLCPTPQIARLKMELSVSLKAREDLEGRLAEMESENLALRAQVAQSQIAMKSTLEEAIKLLQQGTPQ
jgi:hypothetical protein